MKPIVLALVLLVGCRERAKLPGAAAVPATAGSGSSACERYLERMDQLSGFVKDAPYNAAELATCDHYSEEQLRCAGSAPSLDELQLCTRFDPARRALGRTLLASIKPQWGSATDLDVIVKGVPGCALSNLMGDPQFVVTDDQAVAVFALRDPGNKGDPTTVFATLSRGPDGAWQCMDSDPPDRCGELARRCKRR
ncbi:MAG TPA: hypothetical protein VLX92_09305 [Kofleriaceae bacterium]|nr:hypothetical protein [Kofleriaceae bacterium]